MSLCDVNNYDMKEKNLLLKIYYQKIKSYNRKVIIRKLINKFLQKKKLQSELLESL